MKLLRLFCSFWCESKHATVGVRHGDCGYVSATGVNRTDAEERLRFKVIDRGLAADWSTLRAEPQ